MASGYCLGVSSCGEALIVYYGRGHIKDEDVPACYGRKMTVGASPRVWTVIDESALFYIVDCDPGVKTISRGYVFFKSEMVDV